MKPRIYRESEINERDPRDVSRVFDDKSIGMRLADFFRQEKVEVKDGLVVVGGRSSIEGVCREKPGFLFESQGTPLMMSVQRERSQGAVAATVATGPFLRVGRAVREVRDAAHPRPVAQSGGTWLAGDLAGERPSGTTASNLIPEFRWAAQDLAATYGHPQQLRVLAAAFGTRYTFVPILPYNDPRAKSRVFAGEIATEIARL